MFNQSEGLGVIMYQCFANHSFMHISLYMACKHNNDQCIDQ